jgi:hypothetical protein
MSKFAERLLKDLSKATLADKDLKTLLQRVQDKDLKYQKFAGQDKQNRVLLPTKKLGDVLQNKKYEKVLKDIKTTDPKDVVDSATQECFNSEFSLSDFIKESR